jgi:hypothetical protein
MELLVRQPPAKEFIAQPQPVSVGNIAFAVLGYLANAAVAVDLRVDLALSAASARQIHEAIGQELGGGLLITLALLWAQFAAAWRYRALPSHISQRHAVGKLADDWSQIRISRNGGRTKLLWRLVIAMLPKPLLASRSPAGRGAARASRPRLPGFCSWAHVPQPIRASTTRR